MREHRRRFGDNHLQGVTLVYLCIVDTQFIRELFSRKEQSLSRRFNALQRVYLTFDVEYRIGRLDGKLEVLSGGEVEPNRHLNTRRVMKGEVVSRDARIKFAALFEHVDGCTEHIDGQLVAVAELIIAFQQCAW